MSDVPEEIFLIVILGTVILFALIGTVVFFMFAYQRRQFFHMQEKQRMHDQYEREILKTQLEVQEQTHQQISRDIHDNVGQVLAVVRLYLKGIEESCDEKVKARIHETDLLVGGAISDLRNLAHSLSSEQLRNAGLAAVLRAEVERISSSGQIDIRMDRANNAGDYKATEHEINLILFRICQELLANLIRHSGATAAGVEFEEAASGIQITMRDNGVGFVPGTTAGNGLFNIYRRAELIGAEVKLQSNPGSGTETTVIWHRSSSKQ